MTDVNWIVTDSLQYLEPLSFVDLRKIELLEIEFFDHLTVYLQNVLTNHIFDIYVQTGFGIK